MTSRHSFRSPTGSTRRGAGGLVPPFGFACTAILGGLLSMTGLTSAEETERFRPEPGSNEKHELPVWFDDAKLGIFIHWGIYSVPGWAPPTLQFGKVSEAEFMRRNPYAEWYFNSMRLEGSPTHAHHLETYGEDFDYYRFADTFNREIQGWNPEEMAAEFKNAHARYVVLTTKHHDGFTLWPSKVKNPHRPDAHASRDIVGELSKAVKDRGLRMGAYYSGGIDWSFKPVLIDGSQSGQGITPEGAYPAYADAHLRELIERYRPLILWNDIRYPKDGDFPGIVSDYYNKVPGGLINDRWGGGKWSDFATAEYKVHPGIIERKWEATRGIGNSFGYNRAEGPEQMLSVDELVDSFIDIVSKNGNLLLNVGPRADGSIPESQLERLRGLGRWLDVNGEGIFDTRPWIDFEGRIKGSEVPVRFTHHQDRDTVYAFLLDGPDEQRIVLESIMAGDDTRVRLLGHEGPLASRRTIDGLEIELPSPLPSTPALTLAITPQPGKVMRK